MTPKQLDIIRRFDKNGLTAEDVRIRHALYWYTDRMLEYEQEDWYAAGEWMNRRLAGIKPAERLSNG